MNQIQTDTKDRIALITGTSSGFGLLTALKLAEQGYQVVAAMRDLQRKDELVRQAEEAGISSKIHLMTMDVTHSGSIAAALSAIVDRFGTIDVLVNNAGFAVGGFVEEVSMEEWRRQMDTNFFGLIEVTKAVLPVMRSQRREPSSMSAVSAGCSAFRDMVLMPHPSSR